MLNCQEHVYIKNWCILYLLLSLSRTNAASEAPLFSFLGLNVPHDIDGGSVSFGVLQSAQVSSNKYFVALKIV